MDRVREGGRDRGQEGGWTDGGREGRREGRGGDPRRETKGEHFLSYVQLCIMALHKQNYRVL